MQIQTLVKQYEDQIHKLHVTTNNRTRILSPCFPFNE